MAGRTVSMICRTATPFTPASELDEDALRQFLQRFVDAKLGVYLASGGSGEGHALSMDEIRRVYEIGVDVCKGKVMVNANQPELHTTSATIEMAQIAAEAGIEVINIYGPSGLHGYKASDEEYGAFFDLVPADVRHPVALCPNPIIGYLPSPRAIADIVGKHPQVVAVNLSGMGTTPRWIKVALRAFKLPGGAGGPRPPYLMPDDAVVARFAEGAIALDVEEINELARRAGLLPQDDSARPPTGRSTGKELS
jgi:hypothetical protein